VRVAHLNSDENVLEIGCGMGSILAAAQLRVKSSARYLGVDLSVEMVSRGRKQMVRGRRGRRVELLVGSGLALPVCDSLFNVVLLSHVVKYLTDDQLHEVLREARRVLRADGRIILWEFHPVLTRRVTGFILRCCRAQQLRCAGELKAALQDAGFREVRRFRIITPWLPWSNIAFIGQLEG